MRSCVGPVDAVHLTAGPDVPKVRAAKSACRSQIRRSGFDALTPPRSVKAAVPSDHHHSLLPLHSIAAMSGAACPSFAQNRPRPDSRHDRRCHAAAFALRPFVDDAAFFILAMTAVRRFLPLTTLETTTETRTKLTLDAGLEDRLKLVFGSATTLWMPFPPSLRNAASLGAIYSTGAPCRRAKSPAPASRMEPRTSARWP